MKKFFLLCAMLVVGIVASAQNIQVHYDLGRHIYSTEEGERQNVTVTFEHFSADRLGSWFYFVDLDIDKHGMAGAYTEVSREFKVGDKGWAAHMEYDGGLNLGTSFQTSALVGPAWNGHNDDYSTTYSIQAMYKQYFKQNGNKAYASFQLTGVWNTTFAKGKCTFSGFIDLWRGEKADGHGQLVILSEPQFWYNINKKVSVGTEWEFSNNFIFNMANDKTFFFNPTLACKFNL